MPTTVTQYINININREREKKASSSKKEGIERDETVHPTHTHTRTTQFFCLVSFHCIVVRTFIVLCGQPRRRIHTILSGLNKASCFPLSYYYYRQATLLRGEEEIQFVGNIRHSGPALPRCSPINPANPRSIVSRRRPPRRVCFFHLCPPPIRHYIGHR